jgi:SPP1 family predicted phage head-tail adaptor
MHVGRLRQTITVETNTPARDAAGQPIDSWATHCTRRASVLPISARERKVGQQTSADVTHVVTVRSDATTRAITPDMRITWGSLTLHITRAYDLDNAQQWVEMEATEQV